MTEEERQTIHGFISEAMACWGLQGEQIRMAISQAAFQAIGYTERRVLSEAEKYMEASRFQELERRVIS